MEWQQVGTMNLFVAFKHPDGCESMFMPSVFSSERSTDRPPNLAVELVTPPLDDVILPGVTRDRYVVPPLPSNEVSSD